MKNYLLRICLSAIISTIACALLGDKNSNGKLVKMLTGILMTFTVLTPLKDFSIQNITDYFDGISVDAQTYVSEGVQSMQNNTAALIKENTEAYILDKATRMGLDLAVEVELNEENSVPCGIKITGNLSPYDKSVLCDYIEESIGIAKEHQQWN